MSSDASRGGLFRCLTKAKRARLHPIGSSTDASAPALTHVSEKYTNQFLVNIGSIKVSEVIGDLYDKFKRPLTTLEILVSTII